MTVVVGQIEPLKKLKEIFKEKGITRFKSIDEINTFIKNYENEKKEIPKVIETKLDKEINYLQSVFIKQHKIHDFLKTEAKNNVLHKLENLEETYKKIKEKSKNKLFYRIVYYLKIRNLDKNISTLKKNLDQNYTRKNERFRT